MDRNLQQLYEFHEFDWQFDDDARGKFLFRKSLDLCTDSTIKIRISRKIWKSKTITKIVQATNNGGTIFNMGIAVFCCFKSFFNLGSQSGQPIRAGSRMVMAVNDFRYVNCRSWDHHHEVRHGERIILCMICPCKVIMPVPRLTAQIECPD